MRLAELCGPAAGTEAAAQRRIAFQYQDVSRVNAPLPLRSGPRSRARNHNRSLRDWFSQQPDTGQNLTPGTCVQD